MTQWGGELKNSLDIQSATGQGFSCQVPPPHTHSLLTPQSTNHVHLSLNLIVIPVPIGARTTIQYLASIGNLTLLPARLPVMFSCGTYQSPAISSDVPVFSCISSDPLCVLFRYLEKDIQSIIIIAICRWTVYCMFLILACCHGVVFNKCLHLGSPSSLWVW